jgi:hypothetical protein
MNARRCILLSFLLFVSVPVFLIGCNGSDSSGGGGNAIPLGTWRQYAGGETWTYRVTGTVVTGTGTLTVTPSTGTLQAAQNTTTVGTVTGARALALTVPVAFPGQSYTQVDSMAITLDANGTITIVGVSPMGVDPLPMTPAIVGPDARTLSTNGAWPGGTGAVPNLGDFVVSANKQGVENVTVGGRTWQGVKFAGTDVLNGFPCNFTMWLNPHLGAFAKMMTNFTDTIGTTNLTYELQSTNFSL